MADLMKFDRLNKIWSIGWNLTDLMRFDRFDCI